MAIAKSADISYVYADYYVNSPISVSHPALSAGDLIVIYGFGYATDTDVTGLYGPTTTGITWINSPAPNIAYGINYNGTYQWWADIDAVPTGAPNDRITCSLYLGKVNSSKAAGSMSFGVYSLLEVFGYPPGAVVVGTFGGIILSGTSSSPAGAAVVTSSATTNNLTTTAITTTANNSWVLTAGYTPANTNSTSSDLTVPTRNLAYGQLLGYKTVATSGTSTTSNLDAPGTANATWIYETVEIKEATAPSTIAYGPSIRR